MTPEDWRHADAKTAAAALDDESLRKVARWRLQCRRQPRFRSERSPQSGRTRVAARGLAARPRRRRVGVTTWRAAGGVGCGHARPICFASDYGYADDFAGVCRGVVARLAPEVRVIDVTHGLPQRDVMAGALILRNSLPYMPERAVHLTVVDPGVGGPAAGGRPAQRRRPPLRGPGQRAHDAGRRPRRRRGRGARMLDQRRTVACAALGHLSRARHLRSGRGASRRRACRSRWRAQPSTPPASCGSSSQAAPAPRRRSPTTALLVDRFGNVTLNLRARQLADARLGDQVELLCGERALPRAGGADLLVGAPQ